MYQKVFDFTASVPLDQIGLNEKALNQESDAVKSYGGSHTFASLGPSLEERSTDQVWLLCSTMPARTIRSPSSVIRLDRLGRSPKELLDTVDDLKARDVNLISLEGRIDTTSASGELVFHVFGAIAHFERRLISERTKDGQAAARKHGRKPGRPPLQPETISTLQDFVESGKSVLQAAKHLGIGRSTAYKVISEVRKRQMFAEISPLE